MMEGRTSKAFTDFHDFHTSIGAVFFFWRRPGALHLYHFIDLAFASMMGGCGDKVARCRRLDSSTGYPKGLLEVETDHDNS